MRIGVIVPAYNEGPRIGRVLEVLGRLRPPAEVVVVDDGSADDTAQVARRYPVVLVRHEQNLGKGAALQTGLTRLREADAVLFLDADLVGLKEDHLAALLGPLRADPRVGMVVGTFRGGRWHVDLQQRLFAVLNGQRALARHFLDRLPDLSWSRWGVEVLLNSFAAHLGVPLAEVFLDGLTHVLKEEKYGLARGLRLRLQMYKEVLEAARTCRRLFPGTRAPAGLPGSRADL